MRLPVEWLIEEYQMNLFVTAFQVCKNVEDAKDVVQDTFIAIIHPIYSIMMSSIYEPGFSELQLIKKKM